MFKQLCQYIQRLELSSLIQQAEDTAPLRLKHNVVLAKKALELNDLRAATTHIKRAMQII